MIDEVHTLIQKYMAWLQDKTVVHRVSDEWAAITTPHLDRHNDYIRIYVRKRDDGFILTDGGYVIDDLEQSGCPLDTPKRAELLKAVLAGFGVRNEGGQLVVSATPESFAIRKHNLLQAMLAVDDLFYLAQPNVVSLFYEDVTDWFEQNDIRYSANIKLAGKTLYDHHFDFVIPKSRTQPERIVQTINRPSRDVALATAFKWVDTREVRPPGSLLYAMLNDQEHVVSQAVSDALKSYDVRPVLWSEREEARAELAA